MIKVSKFQTNASQAAMFSSSRTPPPSHAYPPSILKKTKIPFIYTPIIQIPHETNKPKTVNPYDDTHSHAPSRDTPGHVCPRWGPPRYVNLIRAPITSPPFATINDQRSRSSRSQTPRVDKYHLILPIADATAATI